METHEGQGTESDEARPLSPTLKAVALLGFGIPCVLNLLRGRWVTAVFLFASILLFLKGREIDRWPKPQRYLAVFVYVALGVAMLVEVVWQVRALL